MPYYDGFDPDYETKFCQFEAEVLDEESTVITGYASVFGQKDNGGDVVQTGAFAASLKRLAACGGKVKMLWQHDPTRPIGVWDVVAEDGHGLKVSGRVLPDVQAGREALALLKAGAVDGLSIGYRTIRSEKAGKNSRLLHEIELWEVSLVTFPMLAQARVRATDGGGADEDAALAQTLADTFRSARDMLA